MALGPRDTTSLVMLSGWDATELRKYELQDGTSFASVVSTLNGALTAVSGELYNDPIWSALVSYTDQPDLEYRVGTSNGMELFTEYGRPDPKRSDTQGHMLPLKAFDRALGWTWDYLRKARMMQIEADIQDAVKDVRDKYRVELLTRLLKRGDDSGAANGLGTSGYSPGFATTAASTDVDFTPPAYGGNTFSSTHEHYVPIAGGAFTAAVFQDAKAELLEHGHLPPYEFIVGISDQTTIEGLTGFVPTARNLVTYGSTQDLASFGPTYLTNGAYAIGTIHDCKIWVVPGVPQYYGFAWKSYGANSQRNPLRIRVQKGAPARPTIQAFPDPRSGAGAVYPLQYMMFFTEFGVGVADRTNGTARYVNNAAWADGTAS